MVDVVVGMCKIRML